MLRRNGPSAPLVLRIALPAVEQAPADHPPLCGRCGSAGFHRHQWMSKAIKDPHVRRVRIARYRCKRCDEVCRSYPAGIGPGRQSATVVRLTLLLHCVGLSYQNVRAALADFGCSLSTAAIGQNVTAARTPTAVDSTDRLRVAPLGGGRFTGPDGHFRLRLVGDSPRERWLEVEIGPGPSAAELRWRFQTCAPAEISSPFAPQFPPETVRFVAAPAAL